MNLKKASAHERLYYLLDLLRSIHESHSLWIKFHSSAKTEEPSTVLDYQRITEGDEKYSDFLWFVCRLDKAMTGGVLLSDRATHPLWLAVRKAAENKDFSDFSWFTDYLIEHNPKGWSAHELTYISRELVKRSKQQV